MDAATPATQVFQGHNSNGDHEVSRQEIQAAIAKAVELRALHAALIQGNSPANLKYPTASPVSRPPSHFSAQDYPVFTPVSSPFLSFFFFFEIFSISI